MPIALYYPHTKVEDESLLKNALVLWDELQYIAPDKHFQPHYKNPQFAEAMEVIGNRYIPSPEDKTRVHAEVKRLVDQKLPEWFVFKPENQDLAANFRYAILPDKFLQETWDLLRSSEFVTVSGQPAPEYRNGPVFDYETSPALGLTLMAILAQVCAGTLKRGITDEGDSYAALGRYFMQSSGFTLADPGKRGPDLKKYERLISISFKTINCDEIPIQRLIELRKKEKTQNNTLLKEAREKYFELLDFYANRLSSDIRVPADVQTIEREFESKMEHHLKGLKAELKLEGKKALLSKEMLGTVVALAATVVEPISTSLISAGLLTRQLTEFQAARGKVLKANPMGWLYMRKRLQVY